MMPANVRLPLFVTAIITQAVWSAMTQLDGVAGEDARRGVEKRGVRLVTSQGANPCCVLASFYETAQSQLLGSHD